MNDKLAEIKERSEAWKAMGQNAICAQTYVDDTGYLLSLLEKAMQYIRKSQYFDCVTCANQKEHDKYPIPDVCSNCHVCDRNATNWRWRGLTE